MAAPRPFQLAALALAGVALWALVNWVYHAFHKPTELLFAVSGELNKTPAETWREYEAHFVRYATPVIAPEFLAALAQIESAGNPLARTYWQWRPSWHPLEVYRPASSAVGLYQITDGTFAQARRACLPGPSGGEAAEAGPAFCWFHSLYARVVPSHAIELTSTLLDRSVGAVVKHQRAAGASLQQKQDLAAVIHLCGAGAGEAYARHRFRLSPGQRCGDHDVHGYLQRINAMKRVFLRLRVGHETRA